MTKNSKTGPVDRFLSEYKAGHLDRRAFIQSAMSVGQSTLEVVIRPKAPAS